MRTCFFFSCCSAVHWVCQFPLKNRTEQNIGDLIFFSPFNLQGAESGPVLHWEIREGCRHGGNSAAWSSHAMKEALEECLRRWRVLLQTNSHVDSRSNNSHNNTSNNMNHVFYFFSWTDCVKRSVSALEWNELRPQYTTVHCKKYFF